jgi:hypothetical protein
VWSEFDKCDITEWVYIKYNCKGECKEHIVDHQLHYDEDTCAYFSLTNDKQGGPQVKLVPLYYLRVWTYRCSVGLPKGQENEVTNIVEHAKVFKNQWVEIPQGAFKQKSCDLGKIHESTPKSFRFQKYGE